MAVNSTLQQSTRLTSVLGGRLFALLALFLFLIGVDSQPDICSAPISSSIFCPSDLRNYCKAPIGGDGWCTNVDCCCISADETFASVCHDEDTCCNGRCCDGRLNFCCGGHCCDAENEICCEGDCTSKASGGIRVALPVVLGILIFMYYVCICRYAEESRIGYAVLGLPVVIIFGIVHIIVGYSSWDCSGSIKAVVGVGFVYMIGGLLLFLGTLCAVANSGQNILQAIAIKRETLVLGVVDTQGNVISAAYATGETAAQIQLHLSRS